MNAILDAYYRGDTATVACVRFSTWNASRPSGATVSELKVSAAYVPGRFFERELPCLLHALKQETVGFDVIVIDGFVHLKPPLTKGLGYYLA